MTVPGPLSAWIRGRSPAAPPNLLSRIEAAAVAMADVLRDGCLTRSAGLDLLAVDALVTYVLEAAADDPQELDARTESAMARIAALAEPFDG